MQGCDKFNPQSTNLCSQIVSAILGVNFNFCPGKAEKCDLMGIFLDHNRFPIECDDLNSKEDRSGLFLQF